MKRPLFRQEALANLGDRPHGSVLGAQLPRARFLTCAALLVPFALLAFGAWGQFTRKEHVTGYLSPTAGLIKIVTPQAGMVAKTAVSEGQAVRQGDVLLVLSSEHATVDARNVQAAMQREVRRRRDSLTLELAKQGEIDALSSAAAARRIEGLELQQAQARDQLELQRARVASAQQTIQRNEALVAASFISPAALQQKQEELMDQRGQLANLLRGLTSITTDLAAARSELASSAL